ncbi:ribbon-helix-helix domain-containing protein [Brucella sp. LJL56]
MARPKLGESETERLHIKITKDELEAIDDWRYENRIPSRSEAVRRLVQIGLRLDRHFDALLENLNDLRALMPRMIDNLDNAVNGVDDEAYSTQALTEVLVAFMNQAEGQKRMINLLYGVLGEAATLKDAKTTAQAIQEADEVADKYYTSVKEVLKPLAEKWKESK